MTRPLIAAVLAALLSSVPAAHADRRRVVAERDRDRDDEDEGVAEAKGTFTVTLDELITASIQASPELARSKADRSVALGKAGGARAGQQWVATAEANYDRYSVGGDVKVDNLEPLQVVDQRKLDAKIGLARNIPTGGNVGLQLAFNRTQSEYALSPELFDINPATGLNGMGTSTDPLEFDVKHQTVASLQFKQPLARGFGPEVALAGEHRADLMLTEETLKTQLAAEDLILAIVTSYWELGNAAYEVRARAEALEIAAQQEKMTTVAVRAGAQPPSANSSAQYDVATRQEALIRAQLTYEKVSLDLRKRVGLGMTNRAVVFKPGDAFEVDNQEYSVDDVLEKGRKTNRKLAAIILQKKVADVDVTVARNAMLPQVDVTLSGGLLGRANNTGDAFSGAFAADGFQLTANLSVQLELSGAARHNMEAAQAQKSRVEIDRVDAERTLEAEVVSAVHQVNAARQRVELTDRAIAMAEQNVGYEKGTFASGKGSGFTISQRQSELVESTVRKGRAIADYHIAVAQLESLSGTLLQHYGVDVRPNRRR